MTEIISRLYGSQKAADSAVEALKAYGFFSSLIFVVGPPKPKPTEAGKAAALEALALELMKGWVLKSQAKIYAEEILAGGVVVTVHAYFGFAQPAITLLDEAGPMPSRVKKAQRTYLDYDEAAPLSSSLALPVLADSHASFSRFFSMPILAHHTFSFGRAFGLPELSKSKRKSTSFGLPLLAKNSFSLSAKLGLPLLSKS